MKDFLSDKLSDILVHLPQEAAEAFTFNIQMAKRGARFPSVLAKENPKFRAMPLSNYLYYQETSAFLTFHRLYKASLLMNAHIRTHQELAMLNQAALTQMKTFTQSHYGWDKGSMEDFISTYIQHHAKPITACRETDICIEVGEDPVRDKVLVEHIFATDENWLKALSFDQDHYQIAKDHTAKASYWLSLENGPRSIVPIRIMGTYFHALHMLREIQGLNLLAGVVQAENVNQLDGIHQERVIKLKSLLEPYPIPTSLDDLQLSVDMLVKTFSREPEYIVRHFGPDILCVPSHE